MLAHRGGRRHRLDHSRREVGGVRRSEPDPPDPVDRPDRPQQVGEIMAAVLPRVHRLAEQRHLAHAVLAPAGCTSRTTSASRRLPLRPAGGRDDAEGAAIIAAALHRNERGRSRFTHLGDVLVVLPAAVLHIGHPAPAARRAAAVRAGSGSRPGRPPGRRLGDLLEEYRPQSLGHAADDAEDRSGTLVTLELPHPADDPLLGVVADGAGIDQHHVGPLGPLGRDVAVPRQHAEHQLGVRDVHLAAVGLDPDTLHGRLLSPTRGGARRWRAPRSILEL